MRVTLGPSVVRGNIDETITGLWTFANVLGLLTNVIGERTAAAGVTVDGLLIQDAGIPEAAVTAHEAALAILESQITDGTLLARVAEAEVITGGWRFNSSVEMRAVLEMLEFASGSNAVFRTAVVGDAVERFALHINGIMQWGDGALARDTNLFRAAANELATDDDFNVGGTLDLAGAFELSSGNIALAANSNDVGIGASIILRVDASGAFAITGFAGGTSGRLIIVTNVNAQSFTLNDQDAGSVAANRIITPTGLNMALVEFQAAILVYDSTTSRWRVVSTTLVT